MHDIEPYFHWRDKYIASEDSRSPFYGQTYEEFRFTQKIYNYYIHPQWDAFGSSTLYLKVLYTNYEKGVTIMEMIGEWNDCLHNDVMYLKRDVIDPMIKEGITKYILVCENVLNFHGSDDSYYEEWYDDIKEEDGWICLLNTLPHVEDEMKESQLQYYINFGGNFNDVNWRPQKPKLLFRAVDAILKGETKRLAF
ncbi:MAG: hypothetical protein DHS20C18_28110 [Saprospiraceae bacterium]|nr:MAG: hypothetical protein DHS20C18_28110 [Saprospiraceae bacterium]